MVSSWIGMRRIVPVLFAIAALTFPGTGVSFADTDPLDGLITESFAHNERVKSLEEQVREAYKTVEPAGSLDNPRLQLGAMNLPVDSYEFDREPMTSKDLALMQNVPYSGKLAQQEKRAVARYRITRAELRAFKTKLSHEVRAAAYEVWKLTRLIQLRQQEKTQLQRFVQIAQSRYETGTGIQADLRRAESRLSRVDETILALKQRKRTARDRLKRLLGGRELPVQLGTILPSRGDPVPPLSEWKARLPQLSPRLRADSEQILAARAGVRLAELDYYPDVDVGVRYRQREDRSDFASVMVTIPLPIWAHRKETPQLQSEQHRLKRFQALYRDRLDELEFQLTKVWYELERVHDQMDLFNDRLMPQAEGTLDSTLSAYRVGRADFDALLAAELEWYRIQAGHARLRFDAARTYSQLVQILGFERLEEGP